MPPQKHEFRVPTGKESLNMIHLLETCLPGLHKTFRERDTETIRPIYDIPRSRETIQGKGCGGVEERS
jgi:hypothetical protein